MPRPPPSLHFVLDFVTYFGADWKKCPAFTSLRTKRKRFTVANGVDWEFDLKCWPNGNASSGPGKVCVALETLGEVVPNEDDEDELPRARKLPSGGVRGGEKSKEGGNEGGKITSLPVAFLSTVGNASAGWKLKDFTSDDTSGWYVVAEHGAIADVSGPDASCLLQIQAWFNPPLSMTSSIAPENRLMSVRKHICSTAVSSQLNDEKSSDLILTMPSHQPNQDAFKIHVHRKHLAAKSGFFRRLLRSGELATEEELGPTTDLGKLLLEHPELPPPTIGTIAPPAPLPTIAYTITPPHLTALSPAQRKWSLDLPLPNFQHVHLLELISYVYSCCYSLPPTLSITFLISLLDLAHALDVRGLSDVVKWYFATVMEHGLVTPSNVYPLFLCAKRHNLSKLSAKCQAFMEKKEREGWAEDEMDELVDVMQGVRVGAKEGKEEAEEEFVGLSRRLRDKLAV